MSRGKRALALTILMCIAFVTGCGPIMSTSNIEDAKEALAKATAVNAEVRAPYEYTMATEYLRKADELWGYSQFGYSAEYAQKAIDMAKAAEEKAQKDAWVNPLAGL